MLLSQYITAVRRLCNDSQRNYWGDAELTDYINEARIRVATQTLCVRKFQTANLIQGQEQYSFTDPTLALPFGNRMVDVINCTVIWGNLRIVLGYLSFSEFNEFLRPWVNYQRTPVCFTVYNQREFWIAYIPDQNYAAEFDSAILPLNLANDNTVDEITPPYDAAVKYWAARLARLKTQSYQEADAQEKLYDKEIRYLEALYPRRIPLTASPYSYRF